jgi:hypothetical protein
MGCDAHFFLERRINKGDWHLDPGHKLDKEQENFPREIPSLSGRSYYFFGVIAGVRATYISRPVAEGRGLPKDACSILKNFYSKEDYCFHSATFLSPKELERALKRYASYLTRQEKLKINMFEAASKEAFNYEGEYYFKINGAVINYIRENLAWEKAENELLGFKNKTEYRIIVWFDS